MQVADVTPTHVGQLSPDGRWRWDGAAWRAVPAPLPAWVNTATRRNATWMVFGGALLIGLLADQALRAGAFGVAASLTLALAGLIAVGAGQLRRVESRVLAGAAALFAAWLTLRASPWLMWPDLLASLALLFLAASFAVRGSVTDLGVAEAFTRAFHAGLQLMTGGGFVARPAVASRGRLAAAAPILRGALIAAPVAAVLAALLASADPVFASFFKLDIDFGTLMLDALYVAAGSWCAAGLLRLAASEPLERVRGPQWRLGATEALVVLAVLDAVFAAFAVAQVLAATGAAAETLHNAGMTYADYARSGFFQLLWVAGITLALLVLFSRVSNLTGSSARLAFTVLACCAIALTLMVDVVAFRRMSLYEEAYGFTMLRLYSHVFAVWLGVVFVLLAADFLRVWRGRRWFIGATLATALLALFGLNIVNPEAVVVALNTSHAQTAHKIDGGYLAELSSDATPALLESRAHIDSSLRGQVTEAACAGPRSYAPRWGGLNFADAQAVAARRASCT